jgi:hypothetical protein
VVLLCNVGGNPERDIRRVRFVRDDTCLSSGSYSINTCFAVSCNAMTLLSSPSLRVVTSSQKSSQVLGGRADFSIRQARPDRAEQGKGVHAIYCWCWQLCKTV